MHITPTLTAALVQDCLGGKVCGVEYEFSGRHGSWGIAVQYRGTDIEEFFCTGTEREAEFIVGVCGQMFECKLALKASKG